MRISVKALPVQEIIRDLAEQWQVEISEDYEELTIKIPEKIGKGFVRGTSFPSGMGIIEYKGMFFRETEIVFCGNDTHPLKFIFCSKGKVNHTFYEDEDLHTFETFQNVIVASTGRNGHILKFLADEAIHVTSIEIIRKSFALRENYNYKYLRTDLKELFLDSVAEKKFFYQGNYSLKAAEIVEEISNKTFSGFLRFIYLKGKLLEMLVLQIHQFEDDMQEHKSPQIIRQLDVERVNKAKEIINENLSENYSVEFLAKEVGTNINKLQENFKKLSGLTVNKYIQQVKLDEAKNLLLNSDYNISEIVVLIGLKNRSYFSQLFKEKYGVSPKYFLPNHQFGVEGKN